MLNILVSIIGIFITILLIIGVHELGHFLTARLLGVKVLRFSIGFGKILWSWYDKKGTEYAIAAIPLGGYVKMLDESEGPVASREFRVAYNRQPIYKKFLIVAAGPFANLLFAFILYWFLFVIGFTSIAPVIGSVIPNSIAEQAGLKPQQRIVSVDQRATSSWMGVAIRVLSHTGNQDKLSISAKTNHEPIKTYELNLSNWHMNNLQPDPISSLGLVPYSPEIPAIIGKVLPNSAAQKAHLKPGDIFLAIDTVPVKDWVTVSTLIDKRPEKTIPIMINRHGKFLIVHLTLGAESDMHFNKHGVLGVEPQFKWPKNFLVSNKYGPITALGHAWQNTYDFTRLNFLVFGKLITGKVSFQSLGGPISIFQNAGSALNAGIIPFISFLAFISIAIGVINIIPIPGLDGGHILFQVLEFINRGPLSLRVQSLMYRFGFILILLLLIQALINDILRL